MSQITVTTQKEWDDIPSDFDGYIYIQSPVNSRIFIAERKGLRVVAWENSSVVARENSSVVARGNSSVEAWENSSVVARGNSSVVARENSSVEARGNSQIAQYSDDAKLKISGNARIIFLPRTIEEYCDFYGITAKDGVALLFKAIRADGGSFHDSDFKYTIGESKSQHCDPDLSVRCSYGLHVSHLHWAIDFGRQHRDFKIIECAVPLDKVVVPKNTDGKVRTSELTVLREVPVEEWGIYGKIMDKKGA